MFRRIVAILLTVVLCFPCFCACSGSGQLSKVTTETETEQKTEPQTESDVKTQEETKTSHQMIPQSETEKKVMKILILGNSHSNDVFFQLGRVFHAQGFEQKYMLGFLYYSGCTIPRHFEFAMGNEAVYDYRRTSGTSYTHFADCTMERALKDQAWDIIFLNPTGSDLMEKEKQFDLRKKLEAYVDKVVPTEHVFGVHYSWPNPDQEQLWSKDWYRQPPKGLRERLTTQYGFDPQRQYTMCTDAAKEHILKDSTYQKTICTGTAIMYAMNVLGVSQMELYRDYTHLTDFGRVLASYSFYAQLTGQKIEEVKLDRVSASARFTHYIPLGDLVLTEEQKQIIKECANYSLENPWSLPTR